MSLEEIAKRQSKYMVDTVGEDIAYRVHPGAFVDLKGVVEELVDVSGEQIRNVAQVTVSKEDVPEVQLGRDEIRIDRTRVNVPPGTYQVIRITEEGRGEFRLFATLKNS